LLSQIRESVKNELIVMATAETALWISAPQSNFINFQEFLCEAEYERVFTRGIDLKPKGFHCEASRYSATVPISPIALVNILMDVDQWSSMFCSIISRARTIDVVSIGAPGSYNKATQVMTAEFQVTTPYVPTRVTQFVRYCHQQSEESWAIVDVSVDSLSSKLDPHSRSQCQKRPSGCFIQGLLDGTSHVVWVEHVDVKDQYIHRKYRQLVETGVAFGARRWIAILQREVERSLYVAAVTYPPSDFCVTPTVDGRKSLLQMAHIIVSHFCADIGNSTTHDWIVAERTRYGGPGIQVSTNKIRDRPNKPPGLTRTAAAMFSLCASHSTLFDFLRDVHLRNQWDHLSVEKSVQEIVHITTGNNARNYVSLLQIHDTYILQECCTDSTGSYIVYAPIDILTVQQLLSGVDPDAFILLVSGFSIQPDMLGCYKTEAYLDNPSLGSLVTVGTQISSELLPKKRGSVYHVCQLIQGTVERIKSVVR
jgi:homeobox-leucine zipper protein